MGQPLPQLGSGQHMRFSHTSVTVGAVIVTAVVCSTVSAGAAALITGAQIKDGTITAADLATNSVTSPKVKDGSLTAKDFAAGTLLRGVPGPRGIPGPATGHAGGALTGNYPNPGLAPAEKPHLVGNPGEPAFGDIEQTFGLKWRALGGGWALPIFRKDQLGIVHLSGVACVFDPNSSKCSGASLTLPNGYSRVFYLPVGYRPSSRLVFEVRESDRPGRVDIASDGQVLLQWPNVSGHSYVSLDGISFVPAG